MTTEGTRAILIPDLSGVCYYEDESRILAGRRYAMVSEPALDGSVVGIGRVLSGPITWIEGEPGEFWVACGSCETEIETDAIHSLDVVVFVRDHRCPESLDVR